MPLHFPVRLRLAVGAENIDHLVCDHLLYFVACNREICARVENGGVVCENTADSGCHGETDIGVDIYLADCHLSCMTEFIFGDADSIGKLAAESVYFLYIFLRNGRSAVQNYREAGKSLGDFLENIKAERGRNKDAVGISCALLGRELICAVACADGDCERINACLCYKFLNLFGACICGILGGLLGGKIMYLLSGGKVNPLIGSAGVSAVPMAARVSQKVGQEEVPGNFLLMHAMGPNVAGVIGSAIAAGVFLALYQVK